MSFDGNGTYNPPSPAYPAISGGVIYAADFNTIIADLAAALSNCITKDGQTGVTANIDFGGNRIINIAPGVSPEDAVTKAQVFTNPTFTTTTASGLVIGGTGFTVTVTNADFTTTALHVALQAEGDNSNLVASTAFVARAVGALGLSLSSDIQAEETARIAADLLKAPLDSPALTGTPTAPNPAPATDSTQIATCHFVQQAAFQTVLPDQTGNAGKILATDGTDAGWIESTATGDVLLSTRVLPFPDYLPCDGMLYSKASYPELFQALLNGPGIPPESVGSFGTNALFHLAVSADGEYIGAVSGVSPRLSALKYASGAFTALTIPDQSMGVQKTALSSDGTYLLALRNDSPWKVLFKLSGTTYSGITGPTTDATAHRGAAFSATGTCALAISTASATYTFSRSGDTFSALTAPSPASGAAVDVKLSADGQYMAVAVSAAPYIRVYKDAGAGAMVGMTAPTDIPALAPQAIALSPAGDYLIALYGSGSLALAAWARSGTVWTRVPPEFVATMPTTSVERFDVQWDSGIIAVTGSALPSGYNVAMFKRTATGIDLHPLPTTKAQAFSSTGLCFLPSSAGNRMLAGFSNLPYSFKLGNDCANLQTPRPLGLGSTVPVKGYIKS